MWGSGGRHDDSAVTETEPTAAGVDDGFGLKNTDDPSDNSPIEEVALTVPITDDPSLPVWTVRVWVLGLLSCATLCFLNQFFYYRTQPLSVSVTAAQIVTLPLGRLMAATLPQGGFLNPGPFNIKEHVLITVFANAGASFGSGDSIVVDIVTAAKAFYRRQFDFLPAFLIILTTMILGFSWAGVFRRYLVEPSHMWWPNTMLTVSLFRTLHEEEKEEKGMTRFTFFCTVAAISFLYYIVPGFLFNVATCMSVLCWIWPSSITAQQIGSGLHGLGIGAFTLDWATVSAYLGSPIATPWFAIVNIFVGFCISMYILIPLYYWNNVYDAKKFPFFGSDLFRNNGAKYEVDEILGVSGIELSEAKLKTYGNINLISSFTLTYGFAFAAMTASLSHVLLWHGRQIYDATMKADEAKPDIHCKLMRQYPDVPMWWFLSVGATGVGLYLVAILVYPNQIQLPVWGLFFAAAIAFFFTLPVGIIAATTNQIPLLDDMAEFIMGFLIPGKPIAVSSFKVLSFMSMSQSVAFLQDFKLGHYMKIPPRAMFVFQICGTVVAALVNLSIAWYQLTSIKNICNTDRLPPGSPWTCPRSRVFWNSSVVWGLLGTRRITGDLGRYTALNWFFLGGFLAPFPFWLLHKTFPNWKWLPYVNTPIMIGAQGKMPPATAVNFTSWFTVGFIFEYYVFHYRKQWWAKYNYILGAALDVGVAFMGVFIFFVISNNGYELEWWGNRVDNCPISQCPTTPGLVCIPSFKVQKGDAT